MAVPREDLLWFVGLFEGEGCIATSARDSFRLDLASTDGFGSKPMFYYRVCGDEAYALLVMMWPFLCSRRQSKGMEALQEYASRPLRGRKAKECRNGHSYTEENTYWHDGKRNCRSCRAKIQRQRRSGVTSLGRTAN